MKLRWMLHVALLTCAAAARASFDLMIVPDPVGGGYVRYDPINRVYLGISYLGGARSVTAVSSRSFGYYVYGGGTVARDNFTGEQLLNNTNSQSMTLSTDGNFAARYSFNGFSILQVGSNGSLTTLNTWIGPAGFDLEGIVSTGPNRWVAYGAGPTGLDMYLVDNNGAQVSSVLGSVATAGLSASGMGQGCLVVTPSASSDILAIPFRDNNGIHRILTRSVSTSSFGAFATALVSGFSTASSLTHLSAVTSHVGFFLVGADSTNPNAARIVQFDDSLTASVMQTYSASALYGNPNSTWRMSNLVAPEPGTMVALGAGAALLMRRRRR